MVDSAPQLRFTVPSGAMPSTQTPVAGSYTGDAGRVRAEVPGRLGAGELVESRCAGRIGDGEQTLDPGVDAVGDLACDRRVWGSSRCQVRRRRAAGR